MGQGVRACAHVCICVCVYICVCSVCKDMCVCGVCVCGVCVSIYV
ncbi:rCG39190, partial [Rattus norvegicus]